MITTARVISFEAPTTSPFTPPNIFLERRKSDAGQSTIAIAAPENFSGDSGRKTSGMQNNAAINGKYGFAN